VLGVAIDAEGVKRVLLENYMYNPVVSESYDIEAEVSNPGILIICRDVKVRQ
jgi:hypothetical protein